MEDEPVLRPLVWLASSLQDFRGFPDDVQDELGFALFTAQAGGRHRKAKTF